MKKWLVHKKGVEHVAVESVDGDEALVRRADGYGFVARAFDLFATEAEARREHVDREACALEEEADRHDRQRAQAEEEAKGHMDDAKWNADKAAECRARAKGLRDALDEVRDATEGQS